jgi:cytochrome c oxidase subunit 3
MAEDKVLKEQFLNLDQQRYADKLGMWIFLMTEIMFFGGMFTAYTVYRLIYPEAWALASAKTSLAYGTSMTYLLITSSMTYSLAIHYARAGQRRRLLLFLIVTVTLGMLFLYLKVSEYLVHYRDHLAPGFDFVFDPEYYRPASLFFCFYYAMTAIHGLHLLICIGLTVFVIIWVIKKHVTQENPAHPEIAGLYWHFVDIIWIFLYPLLYLVNRHI